MAKKTFRIIMTSAFSVIIAALVIIFTSLFNYFTDLNQKELKQQLKMSAVAVNESQESYLSQIPKETYRLTWIDTDGKVLYDTQVDASQLENHKEREEVREAMISGYGSSSRYSQTMTK